MNEFRRHASVIAIDYKPRLSSTDLAFMQTLTAFVDQYAKKTTHDVDEIQS